jgi:hypothetical protein
MALPTPPLPPTFFFFLKKKSLILLLLNFKHAIMRKNISHRRGSCLHEPFSFSVRETRTDAQLNNNTPITTFFFHLKKKSLILLLSNFKHSHHDKKYFSIQPQTIS